MSLGRVTESNRCLVRWESIALSLGLVNDYTTVYIISLPNGAIILVLLSNYSLNMHLYSASFSTISPSCLNG